MEANFFRFAVEELYPEIKGLRIQKIFMPAPGVWTFSFGGSHNLVFFHNPRGGGFFLSHQRPPNPSQPQAQVMWLRKRIKNQHIVSCINLWPWRRMALELSLTREFLVLDICKGVCLESEMTESWATPAWPDLDEISANREIWKTCPQITPPLREALSHAGRDKAGELLDDLKQGNTKAFYLYEDKMGVKKPGCFLPDNTAVHQFFESALEAAKAYGWPRVHEIVADVSGRIKSASTEIKRLRKNLDKTHKDRERLTEMVRGAKTGNLMKASLYALDSGSRLKELVLADENGIKRAIDLDPSISILENMEMFFKKAAKGRRGLDFVQKREKELKQRIERARDHLSISSISIPEKSGSSRKAGGLQSSGTQLRRFRSSDGFIILRAKNRQAGHKLLSMEAGPHDLWLHVQDGPGAHVVLKRDHELVDVPKRTLEEAANLAALASYRKNDLKAVISCVRVRDVRKIKGLEQGRVHVDKVMKSILVNIDQAMESRLEIV